MPDYSEINSLMNHYGERIVEKAMSNLSVYRIVNGKKRRAVATLNTISSSIRTDLQCFNFEILIVFCILLISL